LKKNGEKMSKNRPWQGPAEPIFISGDGRSSGHSISFRNPSIARHSQSGFEPLKARNKQQQTKLAAKGEIR